MSSGSGTSGSATALVSAGSTPTAGAAAAVRIPCAKALAHAARLAIQEDKPVCFDYYEDTQPGGTAFIGQNKETEERILVKSAEEYTSTISRIFRAESDLIVITENSIYIISGSTSGKKISM